MSNQYETWEGKNKQYARRLKLVHAKRILTGNNVRCLTLPGSQGHFEKMLTDAQIAKPSSIVGVERDSRYLSQFWDNAGNELHGIKVIKGRLETVVHSKRKNKSLDGKFDLADIDTCGPFSGKAIKIFDGLLNHLSPVGVCYINHEKGRERNISSLFDLSKHMNGPCDYNKLESAIVHHLTWEVALDSTFNTLSLFDQGRGFIIPAFYMIKARQSGFKFNLEKVLEYGDTHVQMYQYLFSFRKTDHDDINTLNGLKPYWEEHTEKILLKRKEGDGLRRFKGKIFEMRKQKIGETNGKINKDTKNSTKSSYNQDMSQPVP